LVDNRRFNLPNPCLTSQLGVTQLELRRGFWHQNTRVPVQSYDVVLWS